MRGFFGFFFPHFRSSPFRKKGWIFFPKQTCLFPNSANAPSFFPSFPRTEIRMEHLLAAALRFSSFSSPLPWLRLSFFPFRILFFSKEAFFPSCLFFANLPSFFPSFFPVNVVLMASLPPPVSLEEIL